MEQLRRVLERLKDPRWVMRPMIREQQQINAAFPETPAPAVGQEGQPPPNSNVPVKPAAIDSMLTSLDVQQKNANVPQDNSQEAPFRKKMRYLDTMGQIQKQNYPNMQKRSTLGGGGLSEFGI